MFISIFIAYLQVEVINIYIKRGKLKLRTYILSSPPIVTHSSSFHS